MDQNQEYGGGSWSMIPNIPAQNQDSIFLSPHHLQQFQQQQQQQFNHPVHQQQLQQQQQQQYQSPQQQPQQQYVHSSPQQQLQQQFVHSSPQQQLQQFVQSPPQQQQQQQQRFQQQQQQFQLPQQHQFQLPQQKFAQQSPQQQQSQQFVQSPHQQQQQQQPHQQLQQQHVVQLSPPQPQQQQQQQQQQQPSLASHFHILNLVENLSDAIETGTRDQIADALISELYSRFEKCQQLLNSISGTINSKTLTVEGQRSKLEESGRLLNQRRDLITNYRNSIEDLTKSDL